MQKKIIALAIATLSGAAFAQSNVTVYGVADATFDNVKATGVGTTEPGHNRISSNSSYLGFKGSESLGNGLTAVFQLEGGVNTSSGAAFAFDRDTMVALAGGFGTVAMGNLTGPTRALGASLDVFAGATGIGSNSGIIGKFGGALQGVSVDANTLAAITASGRSTGLASPFDTRFKNTVAYITPNFSGVTATFAYVANEGKNSTAGAEVDTSGTDIGVNYTNGPLMVGLTNATVKFKNTAAILAMTQVKASDTRLGASYDFGVAKLAAMYDKVKVTATGVGETQKVMGVGVSVPVGAGKIVGQIYKASDVTGAANVNTGAKLTALGYEHSLSKRTIAKVTYAKLDNKAAANYVFGVNGNPAVADADYSGYQIGLRHSF